MKNLSRWIGLGAVFIAFCTSGCTRHQGSTQAPQNTAREVHLGIWSNYVTPELLAQFEKSTGIHVVVSNYSSNEELLAKMQAGGGGFDVVMPSDYMVSSMIKLGLLKKLDLTQIPSAQSLDPRFMKRKYDPTNDYSLPFDWGTTGIAVNRRLYKGKITGWADIYTNPDLAGKIAMLDDVREVIGSALKYRGHSLNTHDPKDLEDARQVLLQARKRIKLYSSEALLTLTNAEAPVSHAYVSDAMQANKKMNGDVEYILPKEGGTWWIDNLVIPASAEHVAEAHALVNFLLAPKTVVNTVESVFVSPTSRGAMSILPADILKNHAMFPSEKDLAKFEMLEDLGDSMQSWDRVWTELKASSD